MSGTAISIFYGKKNDEFDIRAVHRFPINGMF
ncbi:Uncharacterised protein [Raoultella terrigena]|uniref:Uncharacterized protein n=1 Tax=Raoultella terrigena TaxID=577 RepID=A0A485B953_RAOTE|nr:Uncharacterised protein [Raoultella terrigena]